MSVDRYNLLVREPGKTGDSAVRVVSIADRFNWAVVRFIGQRDIVLALAKCLLVNSGTRHHLCLFESLAACNSTLHNRPLLIPVRFQNTHGTCDVLSCPKPESRTLKEICKLVSLLRRCHLDLFHTILRTKTYDRSQVGLIFVRSRSRSRGHDGRRNLAAQVPRRRIAGF